MTILRYLLTLVLCLAASPAWAAITYVGGQTGSFVGTTSAQTITFTLTGGSDAAPLAGDFVAVCYVVAAAADITLSIQTTGATNYTLFGSEQYRDDTVDTNMRSAYRVMPGTPDTQVVLSETVSGGTGNVNDAGAYVIQVFRGIHATPLEQAVQQGTQFDTMLADPGPITPTTAGTWVYVCGGGAIGAGGVYTSGDLTAFLSSNGIDNNDANIGAGYFVWSSGTFNAAAFGGGGTDTVFSSAAWTVVALAPAAGSTCRGALLLLGVGGC